MDYKIQRQPMTCGSYEAEIHRYHKYMSASDPKAVWLVADQSDAAAHIYFCNFDPKSQGFAGRTLHFTLADGTEIDLPAPWHSNAGALFNDTGVDVRDKHLTFVVVSKDREGSFYESVMKDVLYVDNEPTLGRFDRGKKIAQEIADACSETVYCYSEGSGGSSCGPVCPSKEERKHG